MRERKMFGGKRIQVKKIIAALLAGVFFADTFAMSSLPVLATEAPILPDTSAPAERQPLVTETANGIPLVNISAPSAGGVSRNDYARFNVSEAGAILNNSYTLSKTELAGYVQGNANMAKGAAKIIVNEVTSAEPSVMNGFLEVAGNKADVILANPNGITVNGGGFINTGRAILTTGRPEYDASQNLKDLRVTNDGMILVTGKGMSAKDADILELYTRMAEIHAAIWGRDIKVTTGANVIDVATGEAAAVEGEGKRPDVAIDIKDLGGMYAGRIFLVGNEKGLPANIAGMLEADDLVLDNDGNLYHSRTAHAKKSMTMRAADIRNTGTIASGGAADIYASGTLTNEKTIGAEGDLSITVDKIKNADTLASEQDLTVTTKSNDADSLSNIGSKILANGDVTISSAHIHNGSGQIASGADLTIDGTTLNNEQGKITAYGSGEIFAVQKTDNTDGTIAANGDLYVSGDAVVNARGTMTAGANETITTKDIQLDGILAAGEDLTLHTEQDITNEDAEDGYGVTQAGGNLTITTTGTLTNTKKLEADGKVSLTAKNIQNKTDAEINGGDIAFKSDEIINRGLINADNVVNIDADTLKNLETGRIYGEDITIHAASMENRKDQALEERLADAVKILQAKEAELDEAFAADVTAFTSDTQKDEYFKDIEEKQAAYDEAKTAVDGILAEMTEKKSGTVAARNDLTITGGTLLNASSALLYAGGDMHITESGSLTNRGADIKAQGNITVNAPSIRNENEAFSAERVWTAHTEDPKRIRIDQAGHPERGEVFDADEFSNLSSGYGAYHNKGIEAKEPLEEAGYNKIEQITDEERAEGETPVDESLIGKEAPNYDYDDEIFAQFGITSMDTPRPDYGNPKQAEWDAQYKTILEALNVKIREYNAEVESYNNSLGAISSAKIKDYTVIRTTTHTSEKQVTETRAGTIASGGDMQLTGDVTNENSRITAGATLKSDGKLSNIAEEDQVQTVTFGTTQQSYTKKKRWPHKAWRRHYRSEVFMTPQKEAGNPTSLGIGSYEGSSAQKPKTEDITKANRDNVQDNLKPFATDSETAPGTTAGKETGGTISFIPESSLYKLNPDITAKYLVETDEAFTNKKKFLSSDYMYEQMTWDPDRVAKRLGDGFYEQELIRNQVTQLTGMRYLTGYTSDEEEYKALMDAGIAFAKEYSLTPGIALTKEQMAALTSDIVWLETVTVEVGGKSCDVIYPRVYLRAGSDMVLTDDGSIISAGKLVAESKEEISNQGTIIGKAVVLNGKDIVNKGHIYGDSLALKAENNITQQGQIIGENSVALSAGNDIAVENTVIHEKNQDVLSTTAGIAVKGKDGVILMDAGNTITLTGATLEALGENGSMILHAKNNVTMDTDTLEARKDMTENSDNYIRTYRKTETANTISVGKDITITAGENIYGRNTTVASESGKITLAAGKDVTLENGYNETRDDYGLKYKESGFLAKKTTTIKSHDETKTATDSVISGNEVDILAGGDVNIQGSTVVGTGDVNIAAGKNVNIISAEDYEQHDYDKKVKKSGLLGGGGLGFTIGTEKRKDNYSEADTIQHASTIGSVEGHVSISAGKDAKIEASDILAGKDISINGENVDITGKNNVYHSTERHEYKRSGLTVSVSGGAVDVLTTAAAYGKRGAEVKGGRLKVLYGAETYQTLAKGKEALKDIGGKGMPGINVGIGSASYKSESKAETTEFQGSSLTAGNVATIQTEKDITINGSDVTGQNVTLKAGGNIQIDAAENASASQTKQTMKSGSIGASFMPTGNSVYANASKGKAKEAESAVTYTGSRVQADNMLTMESGEDTTARGSQVSADKVTVNVGSDLTIESLQDKESYTEKTSSKGIGLDIATTAQKIAKGQINAGTGSATVGSSGGHTNSDYKSVTEQAGIYAGAEGFDIMVGGNTHLNGAVIASEASTEKNTLTTGTLLWEDIANEADYEATANGQTVGVAFSHEQNGDIRLKNAGSAPVKTIPVKDSAASTTKSAIADGKIEITDNISQKQDINTLERNTKDSLNRLENIFDKEDIKEQQELADLFAQFSAEKIGDIAEEKGWAKDDARRALLHGLSGAITAGLAGGNAASGAAAGAAMETLQPLLDNFAKEHPELREEASVVIGGAVGKLVGGDAGTGEAVAWTGTKFNWLSHEQEDDRDRELKDAEARGDMEAAREIREYYAKLDLEQDETIESFGLLKCDIYSDEIENSIIQGSMVWREIHKDDENGVILMQSLRAAKKAGMFERQFGNEDFVSLNASIKIKHNLGIEGGFILDRTGNVYYVIGGGFILGGSAGAFTGKLKADTTNWGRSNFARALSGTGFGSTLTAGPGSATISIGTNQVADREVGIEPGFGVSASEMILRVVYICNVNDL